MHLIAPEPGRQQWLIRFRNHDGAVVKIAGERDHDTTDLIGQRVAMLIRAKRNGDPPPGELKSWIDNMPVKRAERLVRLGLLERYRVEQTKPMTVHIDDFEKVVASRKSNSATHAKIQANRVRRIVKSLKATNFKMITEDDVLVKLAGFGLAVSSRRAYIVAIKDFCKWAFKNGRAQTNPLADLKPPGQYEAPEVERQPLTIQQFQKLARYLGTFTYYKLQRSAWTAHDRLLIYWTAVKTAFRKSELVSLRVRNVHFHTKPACISIRAADAKNKTAGEVPIPTDLATELRKYVRNKKPDERLFPIAASSRWFINMFRRDLDGAGIQWDFGDDNAETVDFHTLRATAICWWLDVDGLTPKRVQILARLKTLALVAKYSRNLRLQEFGWLNKGPKLVAVNKGKGETRCPNAKRKSVPCLSRERSRFSTALLATTITTKANRRRSSRSRGRTAASSR